MELVIVAWIFCGIGAAFVAQSRGANGCLWFGLGVLLGPFGLAFAFASGTDRRCPHCRERVHPEATRCPKCQADLASSPSGVLEDDPKALAPVNASTLGAGQLTTSSNPATKKCPDCAEDVRAEARKCRFCGFIFPEPPALDPEPAQADARSLSAPTAPPEQLRGTSAFEPSVSRSVLRTCSFCGVQTLGDEEKCARCGQPFPHKGLTPEAVSALLRYREYRAPQLAEEAGKQEADGPEHDTGIQWWRGALLLLAVLALLLVIFLFTNYKGGQQATVSTGTTPAASAAPIAPAKPSSESANVVLFDGDGGKAEVARDSKAMQASLKYIAIGGAEAKAEMDAMQDSGRLFYVPNGTTADVVEQGETVGGNTPMIVRITSGPHAGEKVMCFKGVTRKR